TTKDYISRAVAAVVDHLGGISANLEYSLRNTLSIPQTEHHIDMLRLRIATWQQHSHKLALERFYMTPDFSRHHCRYILPLLPVHDRLAILPKAEQSTFQFQRMSILLPHHVVERGPRGKGRWGWKPQAFLHLCSAKAKTPRRRGMGTV
ncbi:UNVERIFIED_CONTAM: hypothetical protein Scaly_2015400, partial [Sesamum calycinum]